VECCKYHYYFTLNLRSHISFIACIVRLRCCYNGLGVFAASAVEYIGHSCDENSEASAYDQLDARNEWSRVDHFEFFANHV